MLLAEDPVSAFLPYPAVAVLNARDGALSGLSFAVKDLFDVVGYPTGCGSPIVASTAAPAPRTAPAVQRLLDAGARFIGKTQTDELAFSLIGWNKHFPQPVNARASERVTGGSSSGSAAAVAAGLCDFALGSDTGGSIRAPASFCGLLGLRPTHGRVPLDGAMPLAPSLDAPGFFADRGDVFGKVAPVLLGTDARAFALSRLLRAEDAFALLDGEAAAALGPAEAQVAGVLGAARPARVAAGGLDSLYWAFRHLQAAEAWRVHGPFIERHDPDMTPGVRERFEFGRTVSRDMEADARATAARLAQRLDDALGGDGVLVLPTVPDIAPRRDASPEALQQFRERALRMLAIAGLAGLPQVSLPLAEKDGAPLGLSLVGPRSADAALARLAVEIVGAGPRRH